MKHAPASPQFATRLLQFSNTENRRKSQSDYFFQSYYLMLQMHEATTLFTTRSCVVNNNANEGENRPIISNLA